MTDVILREEGEGENLRKMEDWREKRREETSRGKKGGENGGKEREGIEEEVFGM